MSMLFLCVVWWINLCDGTWKAHYGRELMRLTGVGIFPGVKHSCGYTCKLFDGQ